MTGVKVSCLLTVCILPISYISCWTITINAKLLIILLYILFFLFPIILHLICTYPKITHHGFLTFLKKNISSFFVLALWCGIFTLVFNEINWMFFQITNTLSYSLKFLFTSAVCYFLFILYAIFVFTAIFGVVACNCQTQQKEENK